MKHSCKRCGYETNILSNLKSHLKRDTPCPDLLASGLLPQEILKSLTITRTYKHQCDTCKKQFSSYSGFRYHKSQCENKLQLMQLNSENKLLKEQLTVQNIQQQNNMNGNIQQNNIHNTFHITINALGSENTSYITPEFMRECIKNKIDGIVQYVMKKHFDPHHPENHNIKVEGDNYKILENPLLLGNSKQVLKKEPHDHNFWATLKKDVALEEHILPRVETAFKSFVRSNVAMQEKEKYLEDFIRDIVLPLDWTMEEDDLEDAFECEEEAAECIRLLVYKKIKDSINENYEVITRMIAEAR